MRGRRDEFTSAVLDLHLTPRVGLPEDIARTVLLLSTDDADLITGAIIPIDGGLDSWAAHVPLQRDGLHFKH